MIHLLERKTNAIDKDRDKYEQGIKKLDEAKILVDEMQIDLGKMQPILDQKSKEVDVTMKHVRQE